MSAPLFLLEGDHVASAQVGSTLILDGTEGRHAADAMRLSTGEPLLISDGAGALAYGEVSATAKSHLEMRVSALEQTPAPNPRFTLVQALAKGDRDQQAIEMATELGIDALVAWQSERSIVRWHGERATKALGKWQSTVRAATKQARRPWLPAVTGPASLGDVANLVRESSLTLLLHEEATQALPTIALPASGEVCLIVGPEGGISPREQDTLAEAGAIPVRLGDTVLRSSTAGSAALAALSARERWR